MSIGKDPTHKQGKKGPDEWDQRVSNDREQPGNDDPYRNEKPEAAPGSSDADLEKTQVGGSRPGVESRVKDAIEQREDHEEEEG